MRIVCVIDSLSSGGAQRQMVALAKGFKEKRHDVTVITYHPLNFFKTDLDEVSVEVLCVEEPNFIKRIFKIRKVIRKLKPDAVLSFLVVPNFITTLAGFPSRKWRLVVGERNADPKITTSPKSYFFRFFHLFVDEVVGNSTANIDMVRKVNPLLNKKKTKVISNIIEIPENLKLSRSSRRKGGEIVKIVIAARYEQQKNLEGLVSALKLVPESIISRLRIDWYGNKRNRENYIAPILKEIKANNLDGILSLNDKTKDIYSKYTDADFVALVSFYEGFPNTICEAMALGKPIIVSNVSDIPEFIKDNKNGFLCDPQSTKSIKRAFLEAVNCPVAKREAMGNENRKIAERRFGKESIISNYLTLLEISN